MKDERVVRTVIAPSAAVDFVVILLIPVVTNVVFTDFVVRLSSLGSRLGNYFS